MLKKLHAFAQKYWNTKTQCLLILVIALVVRFWFLSNHIVFSNDSIRDFLLVKQAISNGDYVIELGPKASVGNFYLPPFYYQLHLLLSLIFPEQPLVMNYFITFVESFTPVILFLILKMFIKKEYAVISSILYAVSPLPVYFGTLAWNPVMIPFFSTLSLYCLLQAYFAKKKQYIAYAIILASIANQLHYQSVVLIPFFILCLLYSLYKNRDHLKYYFVGVFFSLVLMTPYFYSEYKSNLQNTNNIINYFKEDHAEYFERVGKNEYVLSFIPSFLQKTITGEVDENISFGRIIFFLTFIYICFEFYKKNYKKSFLIFYFYLIILSLRIYKGDKIDYYMSTLFIAPAIFLGLFSEYLKKFYIPLVFILIAVALHRLQNTPKINDYETLMQAFKFIKENTHQKNLRFYFYDLSRANNLAYFFYLNPEYTLDQESTTMIEVYDKNMDIDKDYCIVKEEIKPIEKIKCEAGYKRITNHRNPKGFIIIVGEFSQKDKAKKTIYHQQPNSKIGHDLVLEGIYENN